MYTIEKAIEQALDEAQRKKEQGLLTKITDDWDLLDWSKGDPETIYTIASLYAQYVEGIEFDNAADRIECVLKETYPEYV